MQCSALPTLLKETIQEKRKTVTATAVVSVQSGYTEACQSKRLSSIGLYNFRIGRYAQKRVTQYASPTKHLSGNTSVTENRHDGAT